mgnify:CR=1 FL=1
MSLKAEVQQLLMAIKQEFPDVKAALNQIDQTLTTTRLEKFAALTDDAIQQNDIKRAQNYLNFIENAFIHASPQLRQFIDTYYAEVILFYVDDSKQQQAWQLIPPKIQQLHKSCWPNKTYIN